MPKAKPVKVTAFVAPNMHAQLRKIAIQTGATTNAMILAGLEIVIDRLARDPKFAAKLPRDGRRATD